MPCFRKSYRSPPQVGKKVTITEILEKDKDDESLRKYKEALLGAAAAGGSHAHSALPLCCGLAIARFTCSTLIAVVVDDGDPRNVIIDTIAIVVKDRPDIVLEVSTPQQIEALKTRTLVFKEGVLVTSSPPFPAWIRSSTVGAFVQAWTTTQGSGSGSARKSFPA